ncbi:MAG: DUF4136 domain-containing protein [Candidatus Zixiibacteriota bacterium]
MKYLATTLIAIIVAGGLLGGCAGNRATVFLHPEFTFNFVERVAIIPFDNLSKEQGAGARVTHVFLTELLSSKAFDVVEPGEVSRVLEKHGIVRTSNLTKEQIISIGTELKVQGLFLGAVNELASTRSGNAVTNSVTLVVRMVETESGEIVWSATQNSGGRGFWSSLFGTGGKSQSQAIRDCVSSILRTLIK